MDFPGFRQRRLSVPPVAYALLGGLMMLPSPAAAQSASPSVPTPDLEQRVRQLEAEVRELREALQRAQGTAPPPAPGATPKAAPRPAAGWQNGFFVQSPDGDFRLRVGGLLQSDLRLYTGRGGDTGNSTFVLRRVRPIFEGTIYRNIDFRIMPDFAGGRAVVQDAFMDLRLRSQTVLRFGRFKAPFNLETLQSSADVQFVERSITNNLVPGRDVGFQLSGDIGRGTASYALGVFNGVPDGTSGDGDTNDDKDIVARIFVQPFRNNARSSLQGLGVGVGASHGRRKEPAASVNLRTATRSSFFRYAEGTTADGDHTRLAPQFYLYRGPLGLLGEYVTSRQRVTKDGVSDTLTHNGFTFQTTYVLTGERASYRGVMPQRPFDPASGQSGAFELGFRYARFRADSDTFRLGFADPGTAAEKVDEYTLGLNWYLNPAVKAQLNYERTDFGRGIRFGPDTRDYEDALLTRFQVGF